MSLQEVNLGRIIFMWKSDWEENKQYYLYDIVRVEKVGLFFCKTPHISNNETKPKEESDLWSLAFDFSHDIKVDELGGIPANQYVTLEYLTQHIKTQINNIETRLNNDLSDINNKIAKKADKSEVTSSAEINNRINTAKTALQNQITSSVNSAKTEITNQTDTKINTAKSELNNAISKKANLADIYTRTECNDRFLGINAKAKDSDKLDGLDSTAFLRINAKASDSDKLDGLDSSVFARKTELSSLATKAELSGVSVANSGLVVRTGEFAQKASGTISVSFSSAFANKCLFVIIYYSQTETLHGDNASATFEAKYGSVKFITNASKTGFSVATNVTAYRAYYLAFGY